MKEAIGDTHDLESLVQLGVFPEDVGLCLSEFWMVLVRIELEDLGGHGRLWWVRSIRVTWDCIASIRPQGLFVFRKAVYVNEKGEMS